MLPDTEPESFSAARVCCLFFESVKPQIKEGWSKETDGDLLLIGWQEQKRVIRVFLHRISRLLTYCLARQTDK